MELSTSNLRLAADSRIDLQLHTTYSDGVWTPDALMDYLFKEDFGLVAITDHDRVDQIAGVQNLALAKRLPVLVAVEMSTAWRDKQVDVLCFGFNPSDSGLIALTQAVRHKQEANTRQAFAYFDKHNYRLTNTPNAMQTILEQPPSRHPHALAALLNTAEHALDLAAAWMVLESAGVKFATNPLTDVVEAVHAAGGVALIAHPGRGDFYPIFDAPLLDDILRDAPLDGFEAYYPVHSAEQTALFVEYANHRNLLVSAGSDSHGPHKKPVPYPAHYCRRLLDRLGVTLR